MKMYIKEITDRLHAGDNDWFSAKMRSGNKEWQLAACRALNSRELKDINGNTVTTSPIYIPVVVRTNSPIDNFMVPEQELVKLLAEMTGGQHCFVAPSFKSLHQVINMPPSDVYALAEEMTLSYIEQNPMFYLAPVDADSDMADEGGAYVYRLLILGATVIPTAAEQKPIVATSEQLHALANLLSLYFTKEGEKKPKAYVGVPSLYERFLANALMTDAIFQIETLASQFPGQDIEMHLADDAVNRNMLPYDIHVGGQKYGSAVLPSWIIEEFQETVRQSLIKHKFNLVFMSPAKTLH